MTEDNTIDDVQRVRRTDHGLSIEAKITRGTDVRDQEEYRVKAKGETAEECLGYFEEGIQSVEEEYAGRLRGMQPDAEDDDGEEEGS